MSVITIEVYQNIEDHLAENTPPPKFCMNGLTIMIGPLGLIYLNKGKMGIKQVNKLLVFLLVNQTSPNGPMIIVRPLIQN